ncbi:alpha/beta hydrolase fold family protein [Myriangium duriaei CBS 260.36]|uniref:Alpha/beta hydrolase fold family protein n=1 Tax=Myriangium duriaei CBS 260.36 TaxID=1168546 RepID=A0A9P4MP12_9PEZI|nr:alpha/beta hydrolase fold family protein [Myriangium duriaei CBS 260.36]
MVDSGDVGNMVAKTKHSDIMRGVTRSYCCVARYITYTKMPDTKTVHVPHLGGIDAAYRMSPDHDSSKPTLVLVHSFMTSSKLYATQFENTQLTDRMNLIAIELLGHGQTRTKSPHFTYWDTASMNLQVLDALGIKGKLFVLGTSQGGWITVRMALLAPDRITGIIPLGTCMDYESERIRELGCWDGRAACTGSIDEWSTLSSTPDFAPSEDFCNFLVSQGFGKGVTQADRDFWVKETRANYAGDDGRLRARMSAINLRDRDGLLGRLFDVRCPVLWLHGTSDPVYNVPNAEEEIKLFVNSPDARVQAVQDGAHFLSFSHPKEVNEAILGFIQKYGGSGHRL